MGLPSQTKRVGIMALSMTYGRYFYSRRILHQMSRRPTGRLLGLLQVCKFGVIASLGLLGLLHWGIALDCIAIALGLLHWGFWGNWGYCKFASLQVCKKKFAKMAIYSH